MRFGERTIPDQPRFCPRCRKGYLDGSALCALCGETLCDQGYCGICEQFWPLPAGEDCPKHELALEDQAPMFEPWAEPGETSRLVTVAMFSDAGRAAAVRIRLEAEGIPTVLQGERMGNASMYQVATGGIWLQVPQRFAGDARIVLDQSWVPPSGADDLDDAWDELAPDPAALRRSIMKGIIFVILIGPLVVAGVAALIGL
jgi:hypothetical protein